MRTINLMTKLEDAGNSNSPSAEVEISDRIFSDMLEHIRPLLSKKGGTSEWQIKDHFRNMRAQAVEQFLSIAMKRGIIKEAFGTYSLSEAIAQ